MYFQKYECAIKYNKQTINKNNDNTRAVRYENAVEQQLERPPLFYFILI